MNVSRLDGRALACLWGVALFTPSLRGYIGTIGAILVNGGLLALAVLIVAWCGVRIRFVDEGERTLALLVLVCLVYYMVAITFSTTFLAEDVIFRDLFELHKPVLHAASFLLASLTIATPADAERFRRILRWCFVLIVGVSILQLVAPPAFAQLYTKSANIRAGRLAAPFGNPYDYGFAVSLFAYYFLFRYLERSGLKDLAALAVALMMIVLTQSRTAVITLGFALAVLVPAVVWLRHREALSRLEIPPGVLRYGLLVLAVVAAGVVLVVKFRHEVAYLVGGIQALILRGEQSSLDVRLGQLEQTFELANQSILVALFGNGISKSGMEFLESGYAFYLFRFGVLGLVVIFILPLVVVTGRLLQALVVRPERMDALAAAVLVWLASLFVASMGNNFTEQPRLSFMYYFMLGFALRWAAMALADRSGAERTAVREAVG